MKPKPTPLGFALLGLLWRRPQSGYDLRKVFATTALGDYSSSPGAIYPALRRLEDAGLVSGEVEAQTSLRPRKVFRLTNAGEVALVEWLRREIEPGEVERGLQELMLRFAFHFILDDAGATRQLLESLERECRAQIEELKTQRTTIPEESPPHTWLALDAGIDQYRATVRWARRARAVFEEDPT